MAMSLYVGLPGSGKSYGVVENVILPALQGKRKIFTNIPLKMDVISLDFPDHQCSIITDEQLLEHYENPVLGAVYVLDEYWRFCAGGARPASLNVKFKEFYTMLRHRSDGANATEIVLVTQNPGQICSFVRDLVDFTFLSVKLDQIGMNNKYRIDVYARSYASKPPADYLRQIFGTYKESVYKYYISQSQGSGGHSSEKKVDGRANGFKSFLIRYGLPLGVLAVAFGVYHTITFLTHFTGLKKNDSQASTVQFSQVSSVVSRPTDSTTWRLVAFVSSKNQVGFWAVNRVALRRLNPASCHVDLSTHEPSCIVDGEVVAPWTGPDQSSIGNTPQEAVTR